MSTELSGLLIALLVPVCFGSGMVLARVGLVDIPSGVGNFLSLIVGWGFIAGATAALYPEELFGVTLAAFGWLALIGLVNFPLGRYMNFVSLRKLGVLKANPVLAMAPVVSAFEGVVFLGERINAAVGAGTLLAVSGLMVVVYGEARARGAGRRREGGASPRARGLTERFPLLVGYLAAGCATVAYGTVPALGRVAVTELTVPLVSATYTMLVGWIVMGLFSARGLPSTVRGAPARSLAFIAVGGLSMSTGVALLYLALSRAPVVIVSPVFALNTFVALALAHVFLQRLERITPPLIIGTALVVGGVAGVVIGTEM